MKRCRTLVLFGEAPIGTRDVYVHRDGQGHFYAERHTDVGTFAEHVDPVRPSCVAGGAVTWLAVVEHDAVIVFFFFLRT